MVTMAHAGRDVRQATVGRESIWSESESTSRAISVCLLEEEQVFRAGCEHYMSVNPRIALDVSIRFPGAEQALSLVLTHQPDVLMLGLTELNQRVIDLTKAIQKTAPSTGIILCFTHASDAAVFALRDVSRHAGAGFAFLPKHSVESATHLMQLVEAVAQGRVILDPTVMGQMLSTAGRQDKFLEKLSRRESEILAMIAQGMSNQDMADTLFLERKTIERHINGIYGKLSADNVSGHVRVKAVLAYLLATGRMAPAA